MRLRALGAMLVVATASGQALAQDTPTPAKKTAPATRPDVPAEAPRPGQARNVEVPDETPASEKLALVPRLILFIPRWTFAIAMWPVRESLYRIDHHDIIERLERLFSGDAPVTLYPSAIAVAGQGITYGIGVGYHEYANARFLFGGEARQIYGLTLTTGELLGSRFALEAEGELQRLRNVQFNGIGNESTTDFDPEMPLPLIDAVNDPTSVATRLDSEIRRLELAARIGIKSHWRLRLSGAYIRREFGNPDDRADPKGLSVLTAYQEGSLVGFGGYSQLYAETRAVYDDRSQPDRYVSGGLPTRGWKLTGFTGITSALSGEHPAYLRIGADLQRYQHLIGGDRVLIARAAFEWVDASVSEVPFADLPTLGGSTIMRGYQRGRFRDRVVALTSLEYRFPLHRLFSGFVFTDTGGAFRVVRDINPNEFHLGGGIGLNFHTAERLLFRAQIGLGEDGIVLNASLRASDRVRRTTKRR